VPQIWGFPGHGHVTVPRKVTCDAAFERHVPAPMKMDGA
jgi:hypothetical protein